MINRCAVTWDELLCFVTASCAVRLHHSFSFCVVFPLKRLTEPGWVGRAAQFCWQGEMESAWPGVLHQRRGRFPAEHSCFPQSPVTASDCVWGCVQGQLLQGNLSSGAHRILCLTLTTERFPWQLHLQREVGVVC